MSGDERIGLSGPRRWDQPRVRGRLEPDVRGVAPAMDHPRVREDDATILTLRYRSVGPHSAYAGATAGCHRGTTRRWNPRVRGRRALHPVHLRPDRTKAQFRRAIGRPRTCGGLPHLRQLSLTEARRKSPTTPSCAFSRSQPLPVASSSGSDSWVTGTPHLVVAGHPDSSQAARAWNDSYRCVARLLRGRQ